MSVYAKLMEIQAKASIAKSSRNDFGKYNYRSFGQVLAGIKAICQEHGCALFLENEVVEVGGRNYMKATATLVDIETGEKVSSSSHVREEETKKGFDAAQISASAMTYARKYALIGLFCIDDCAEKEHNEETFDDCYDYQAYQEEYERERPLKSRDELLGELAMICKKRHITPDDMARANELDSIDDASNTQIDAMIRTLKLKWIR